MKSQLPYFIFAIVIGIGFIIFERHTQHLRTRRPKIVAYTYSSFNASWGPGPQLIAKFENQCACRVEVVAIPESGLLVQRLLLEKSEPQADLVIGLDQVHLDGARKNLSWVPVQVKNVHWSSQFPTQELSGDFVPIDWSPMAFIYRENEVVKPPKSWNDLLDPQWRGKIALEDPSTSIAGVEWLFWVFANKGSVPGLQYLRHFLPQIQSLSSSWSSAYGLFKKHRAELVFSYLTSPVYHWQEEKDFSYQPAVFNEGHPYQIDYAGVLNTCRHCNKAKDFVRFLLQPESQKILMNKNYMYPVVAGLTSGTLFARLPKVKLLAPAVLQAGLKNKDELLKRWQQLSR